MKPSLIDLYCKAGGAGKGYLQAGFLVHGVDIKPQPRYPSTSGVADVLTLTGERIAQSHNAIHASPPCQAHTALNNDKSRHLNLIPATRDLLDASGLPYVIENVMGAAEHLRDPIMLCGCMFGLGTATHRLERRRLFECKGFRPPQMACLCHLDPRPVIGVYGGHARDRSGAARSDTRSFIGQSQRDLARQALGMDWGTLDELSEAIPPAYTHWLGTHLRAALT